MHFNLSSSKVTAYQDAQRVSAAAGLPWLEHFRVQCYTQVKSLLVGWKGRKVHYYLATRPLIIQFCKNLMKSNCGLLDSDMHNYLLTIDPSSKKVINLQMDMFHYLIILLYYVAIKFSRLVHAHIGSHMQVLYTTSHNGAYYWYHEWRWAAKIVLQMLFTSCSELCVQHFSKWGHEVANL